MPENYFQFKSFLINQDQCAMKVSTDACLQGAVFVDFLKSQSHIQNVLDIGAGTGLLTLMLAQAMLEANFTALEIEANAALQAEENFRASKWHSKIQLVNRDFKTFETKLQFDAIICNPPFFKQHFKSNNHNRNQARHDDGLSKKDLANGVSKFLASAGFFCVMYPLTEWHDWLKAASNAHLNPRKIFFVRPNSNKAINRVIGIFSKDQSLFAEVELSIYEQPGIYTNAFKRLLTDYYLYL